MAKQGKSKALSDPKRNADVVKEMMRERSPVVMGNILNFIEKNFDGVSDIEQFDKEGNRTDTMSKSAIEKMKLSHKLAHKIIDKMTPNTLIIDNVNGGNSNVDPKFQEAAIYLANKARADAEAEAENNIALTEIQAREVRTIARSEER